MTLRWTTTRPTVPGWYWMRYESVSEQRIYMVYVSARRIRNADKWWGVGFDQDAEWAGPIEPPAPEEERT